ncbi:MAG: helix-turn-helix domain-containing protein [Thermoanaerobaculaceae bacterium]
MPTGKVGGGTVQLTVRDVARLLRVSEKTVYRWIALGRLIASMSSSGSTGRNCWSGQLRTESQLLPSCFPSRR